MCFQVKARRESCFFFAVRCIIIIPCPQDSGESKFGFYIISFAQAHIDKAFHVIPWRMQRATSAVEASPTMICLTQSRRGRLCLVFLTFLFLNICDNYNKNYAMIEKIDLTLLSHIFILVLRTWATKTQSHEE
jgi:hypothetical protein